MINAFLFFAGFLEIDECESNPCVNGNCTDYFMAFECVCILGYIGETCDIGKLKTS